MSRLNTHKSRTYISRYAHSPYQIYLIYLVRKFHDCSSGHLIVNRTKSSARASAGSIAAEHDEIGQFES
jgi:hypothetical protein